MQDHNLLVKERFLHPRGSSHLVPARQLNSWFHSIPGWDLHQSGAYRPVGSGGMMEVVVVTLQLALQIILGGVSKSILDYVTHDSALLCYKINFTVPQVG